MPTSDVPAVLIAQLTDTHVVHPETDEELFVDNNGRLAQAVAMVNGEQPTIDVVLGTGDLVNWGSAAEYETLAGLLSDLQAPFLPIPGNHDDRTRMKETFGHIPWADSDHASWVTVVDNVRIIGLDTTIPGKSGAEFDDERESWLRAVLSKEHEGSTLLATHHPPFLTGIEWMDRSGFVGLDRLATVLADRELAEVDRVVAGHFHRPISSSVGGVPAQVGLSTVQHVDLDLEPGGPISLILDPPGYQILRCNEAGIVSHTRYLETGTDGFVPYWAQEHEKSL